MEDREGNPINLTTEHIPPDLRVYEIVSIVAYLAGVNQNEFDNGIFKRSTYHTLNADSDYGIIRSLCRVRTAILSNMDTIQKAMQQDYKNIHTLPELIPAGCAEFLFKQRVLTFMTKPNAREYLMEINKHISERINCCERLIPMWINWKYIKNLFIMPHGQNPDRIDAEIKRYVQERQRYPYRIYLNTPLNHEGNLLYHDGKFLYYLYAANDDYFTDRSKVIDTRSAYKTSLYTYLRTHSKIAIIVDCENSDPYRVCSVLRNIQENCQDSIQHICKVVLYDDVHTSYAWQILEKYIDVPIQHNMIERINGQKSLVDVRMTAGACRDFYEEHIPAFILVSSDSDYWGLMTALSEAAFLVLAEREKIGTTLRTAMKTRRIEYCFMDDFYSGNISDIKAGALIVELKSYITDRLLFNVDRLLDSAIERLHVPITQEEKIAVSRQIKKRLDFEIAENGDVKVKF